VAISQHGQTGMKGSYKRAKKAVEKIRKGGKKWHGDQ